MLKTLESTKSTIKPGKGGVGVGGDGNETLTLRLKTSSSTDSLTSAAQIVVEFNRVDAGDGAVGKLVKNLSKSRKIVKESKSFKSLKNLQRPLVWRNVYQSTNLLSLKYQKLKFWQFFKLFLLGSRALLMLRLE